MAHPAPAGAPHVHRVSIYYEDTDFSGFVYHANYLAYMERAREHLLGREALVSLWQDHNTGFVVYKAGLTYKSPARFGDELEVRTRVAASSPWRLSFQQDVWRAEPEQLLVEGRIELVTVDPAGKLIQLPDVVRARLGLS